MYMKNGIFLCLILLLVQSCTTYSVLPKNINNHSCIEGVYSNMSGTDTIKSRGRTLWSVVDWKHEIKIDNISVKIEIVNPKKLRIIFIENYKNIGEKLLKGKFKEDECFYTRRQFIIIPILPIIWGYSNTQKRIYQIDNELIIETTDNHGGVFIFMASGDKYNEIWTFKQLDN